MTDGNTASVHLILDQESFEAGIRKANRTLKGSATEMNQSLELMKKGFTVFQRVALDGAKSLVEVEKAVAEVSTLIDDKAGPSMQELRGAVEELSLQFGTSAQSQAKAYYQAISAGAEAGSESVRLLEVAGRAAVGGVTTTTEALDLLTTTINAFGLEMSDADRLSDEFFTAVKLGKTTMGELSASFGLVASLAASFNLETGETSAALASITKAGVSTSQAVTQLRSILVAVAKPKKQAKDIAHELGIEFNATALEAKGLHGFLMDVVEAADGNKEQLARLFGRVEALSGVLNLTTQEGEVFRDTLDQMAESAGATETAFGKMSDTMDFKINKMKAGFESLKRSMFDRLNLPFVVDFWSEYFGPGGKFDEHLEQMKKAAEVARFIANPVSGVVAAIRSAADGGAPPPASSPGGLRFSGPLGASPLFSANDVELTPEDRAHIAKTTTKGDLSHLFGDKGKKKRKGRQPSLRDLSGEASIILGEGTAESDHINAVIEERIDAEKEAFDKLIEERKARGQEIQDSIKNAEEREVAAWQSYGGAVQSTIGSNLSGALAEIASGNSSVGDALKKMAGETIVTLGQYLVQLGTSAVIAGTLGTVVPFLAGPTGGAVSVGAGLAAIAGGAAMIGIGSAIGGRGGSAPAAGRRSAGRSGTNAANIAGGASVPQFNELGLPLNQSGGQVVVVNFNGPVGGSAARIGRDLEAVLAHSGKSKIAS